MFTMNQLMGLKVFKPLPEKKRLKKDGTPRNLPKLGKVHNVVFSPDGSKVVGLLVKRPDVAGMVARDDVFLGVDSFDQTERGLVCTRGDDSFDDAARKRLSLDWDRCIIWGGMDVRSVSGKYLGFVSDIFFADTGRIDHVLATDGGVANALVGGFEIPVGLLRGTKDGSMIVDDTAEDIALSGGLAARAGEGVANLKLKGKDAGKKASVAVDKGSFALGQAIGKAKNAIKEAQEGDETKAVEVGVPATPAADVRVEASSQAKSIKSAPSDAASRATYAPAGQARTGGAGTKPVSPKKSAGPSATGKSAAAKADSGKSAADEAAAAIGRQLGKTRGMFAAFKKEFDESSK